MAKTIKPVKTSEKPTMEAMTMRLSQQFNLLAVLLIALFLFQAYTFYKVKTIEKKGVTAGTQQQAESPLTNDKLITYASDLKLDKKKFEQCLTSGSKKEFVSKDAAQGAELGVQGTPGFFINGRFLAGAFPFEAFKEIIDKELDGTATSVCTDYSESMQQYCSDPNNIGFNPEPKEIALGNAPALGKTDAKVTIVEFSDFECPFCIRAFPTVQQIEKEYPNDVKIVYKQFPLTSIHPHAQTAAEASMCAAEQGKFWEYHDRLFTLESQG